MGTSNNKPMSKKFFWISLILINIFFPWIIYFLAISGFYDAIDNGIKNSKEWYQLFISIVTFLLTFFGLNYLLFNARKRNDKIFFKTTVLSIPYIYILIIGLTFISFLNNHIQTFIIIISIIILSLIFLIRLHYFKAKMKTFNWTRVILMAFALGFFIQALVSFIPAAKDQHFICLESSICNNYSLKYSLGLPLYIGRIQKADDCGYWSYFSYPKFFFNILLWHSLALMIIILFESWRHKKYKLINNNRFKKENFNSPGRIILTIIVLIMPSILFFYTVMRLLGGALYCD